MSYVLSGHNLRINIKPGGGGGTLVGGLWEIPGHLQCIKLCFSDACKSNLKRPW